MPRKRIKLEHNDLNVITTSKLMHYPCPNPYCEKISSNIKGISQHFNHSSTICYEVITQQKAMNVQNNPYIKELLQYQEMQLLHNPNQIQHGMQHSNNNIDSVVFDNNNDDDNNDYILDKISCL